jgi:hypothetical protein
MAFSFAESPFSHYSRISYKISEPEAPRHVILPEHSCNNAMKKDVVARERSTLGEQKNAYKDLAECHKDNKFWDELFAYIYIIAWCPLNI